MRGVHPSQTGQMGSAYDAQTRVRSLRATAERDAATCIQLEEWLDREGAGGTEEFRAWVARRRADQHQPPPGVAALDRLVLNTDSPAADGPAL